LALNGKFVIDCVTHAFDNRPENAKAGDYARALMEHNFQFQWELIPDPYRIPRDRFFQAISAEALTSALFLESDTDVAFYHTIPAWGVFHDLCPLSVAIEIQQQYPGRMFLYGAASPLEGEKAIEDVIRQNEDSEIVGVKLYPVDIIDGKVRSYSMGDEKLVYPLLEKCRELGIRTIAIHKAVPLGTAPMDPFLPNDIDYAARDFPDLNFEIVHGGFAFLEESASQVSRFQNVYINLEVTAQLLIKHPLHFARIVGEFLIWNGAKKLFWGTGCTFTHPAPVLEAFEKFQMPSDLVERDGYPEMTEELKADILANNFAAMHGMDVEAMKAAIEDDEISRLRAEMGPAEPWGKVPKPTEIPTAV
jgi:uncharacterized protein